MPEPIASVDQDAIKSGLSELVQKTIRETINGLLDERADELVGAGRYERSAARDACRARVVGTLPDGRSARVLVAARLKYVAKSEWGTRRYLDVSVLESA